MPRNPGLQSRAVTTNRVTRSRVGSPPLSISPAPPDSAGPTRSTSASRRPRPPPVTTTVHRTQAEMRTHHRLEAECATATAQSQSLPRAVSPELGSASHSPSSASTIVVSPSAWPPLPPDPPTHPPSPDPDPGDNHSDPPISSPPAWDEVCPVCRAQFHHTRVIQHINNSRCAENMRASTAAQSGLLRCGLCRKWRHVEGVHRCALGQELKQEHEQDQKQDVQEQDLERSHEQVQQSAGSLLPDSYVMFPHMWDSIPAIAQKEWTILCNQNLEQVYEAHMRHSDINTSTSTRDRHIMTFLFKPRHILQRTTGQKQAARKLKRHMNHIIQQQQPPPSPSFPPAQQQQQHEQATHPQNEDGRRISLAARRVNNGNVRKAMDALLQTGVMMTLTDEVIRELEELHPAASAPIPKYDDGPVQQRWLGDSDISHRPDTFYDNGSSAGPSGWTGAMIRPLLQHPSCRLGLALIFSLIMNGEIHDRRLREMLRAARLLPIPKDAGAGVRPIAVGEVMVRIACNFGMARINTRLSSIFSSIQLGMGVPAGVETCIITAQALLDQHVNDPSIIMISTDVSNAFNTVSRSSMMKALHENVATRELCPLFAWCHDGASPLIVYKQTQHGKEQAKIISSQEGTQQGNVMGSFCFDMSIQSDYLETQQSHPNVRLLAIHDDLHIIGPATAAFAAADHFKERLEKRGDLKLRPNKCRVLIPAETSTQIHTITAQARARQFQTHLGSMAMHGGCVGSNDAIKTKEFKRVVSRYTPVLRLISDRRMQSQAAFHILRHCVITGVGFHSRVMPPQLTRQTLEQFDQRVIEAVAASHRLPDSIITDPDRKQLMSFIGIAPCTRVAPIAYLSCVLSCMSSLPALVPRGSLYLSLRDTHRTITSSSTSPCHSTVSSHIPLSFSTTMHQYMKKDKNVKGLQRKLHHTIKKKDRQNIDIRTDEMGQYMRAMLNSTSNRHANLIFRLLPTHTDLRLSSDNWNQLIRSRLLLPSSDHLPTRCPHGNCNASLATLMSRAHHQHACQGMMPERTLRHDAIVDIVLKLARRAGYVTEKEKRFDNDGLSMEMRKLEPDVVMIAPDPTMQPLMLDVGVTHPCSKSHIRHASLPTGILDAARGMLDDKRKKYNGLAKIVGYRFIGLIVETYGGMVDEFHMLIDALVEEAMDHQQLSLTQAKQLKIFTYGAISAALHRGNGLLARRLYQVPSVDDISFSDFSHHAPILAVGTAWGG